MLKKLLSNLAFNPSLIEQVPAYMAKIKRDQRVRILAFVILLVAVAIQIFILIFPTQSSLTNSPNDIIRGGFKSQTEAYQDCVNNVSDFKIILSSYMISCDDVSNSTSLYVHPSSDNNNLFSLNRIPYGVAGEKEVTINTQQFWLRPLSSLAINKNLRYKALAGNTNFGSFMILFNSGDLVFSGTPSQGLTHCNVSSCPVLSASVINDSQSISNANNTSVKPDDQLVYVLSATNETSKSFKNFTVRLNAASLFSYTNVVSLYGGKISGNYIVYSPKTILPGQTITDEFAAEVDSPIPLTTTSSSDPGYYNLRSTVVYGKTLTIKMPLSLEKLVENSSARLPLWGIYGILPILLVVIFSFYFIAHNSLSLKELNAVRRDYNRRHVK
jgi:hypothetical protein